MKSNWLIVDKHKEDFGRGWGYHPIILQLLWNLDIKSKAHAEDFLNPKYENLNSPYLFDGTKRAIERVFLSCEKKEQVFIYGDYDADGVDGAVILYKALTALGINPNIYIPHREREGYGLNKKAIDYMKEKGAGLVITCDCGVSNNDELSYAKSVGIDVIVTDHHTLPPKLSKDAYAIVHPQVGGYPFKELSGGAVAFKLSQALLDAAKDKIKTSPEQIEKWMLDLVAISTVGDVMPLVGENRILVHYGLKVLNKTRCLGLKKLIKAAGLKLGKLNTYSIGFQIAPRINAAGRMDHANTAYELLIEQNEPRAIELAEKLNQSNIDRQKQTELLVNEAKYQVVEKSQEKGYCLFAYKEDWPLGLLGLAAGHLVRVFNRPAVLLTKIDGKIKGSARGIEQFNVIKALQKLDALFIKYGGHPMAAGMSLAFENLEEFEKRLLELAREDLQDKELVSYKKTNEIDIDEIDLKLAEELQKFEPFGEANPKPLFLSRQVEVRTADTIGNGDKHLRLSVVGKKGIAHKMIGFCFEHYCQALPKVGEKYDIVYEIGINEWNGRRETQLKIVDMDKS